jgi:hypothetical protein
VSDLGFVAYFHQKDNGRKSGMLQCVVDHFAPERHKDLGAAPY